MTTASAARQGDVDPVLAAVLHKRVEAVTREMATVLLRSTRSTIFDQVGDFITAVFDARARTLAQTEYAAIIAFGAQPPLEHIIEYFGDDLADGDVILHNDVFSRGNQNHDLGVFVPVFWEGGWSPGRWPKGIRPTWGAPPPGATTPGSAKSGRRRCGSRRSRFMRRAGCGERDGVPRIGSGCPLPDRL